MSDSESMDAADCEPADCDAAAVYPEVDLVCLLIETPFARRTEEDRRYLLHCPRPQPELKHRELVVQKQTGKQVSRNFRMPWYNVYLWLCGSWYLNRLFCWPCLLLCKKMNTWNNCGFEDIRNATRALNKHEESADHLKAFVEYTKLLKKDSVQSDALAENWRLQSKIFNDNVKLNRQIFKIMVDATLYLTKQEVPFQECSDNFKELINIIVANAPFEVQNHYEKIKNNFGPDDMLAFHSGIVKCIYEYLMSHVDLEIEKTTVYSMQVYDVTDVMQSPHCAVIFRFVTAEGILVEHLIGFRKINGPRTPQEIYNALQPVLRSRGYQDKLIAQYYDGGILTAPEHLNELQALVKQSAVFVPVLTQHLNVVLEQSLCKMTECKRFFSYVTRMRTFFEECPKRRQVFDAALGSQTSDASISSNAKLIGTMVNGWQEMKVAWLSINADEHNDQTTICESEIFASKLNDFEFAFLALILYELFELCEILFNMLHEKPIDSNYFVGNMKWAWELFENKRTEDAFQSVYVTATSKMQENKLWWPSEENGGIKVEEVVDESEVDNYRKLFFEIVDCVLSELKVRLCDMESISFISLADSSKTEDKATVATHLSDLKELYPNVIRNEKRLKSQLEIIFKDPQYRNIPLQEILDLLIKHDLNTVLQDAYSLFSLVLTIPSTEPSTKEFDENCFARVKKMKKYLHTLSQEKLSQMAYISIEKDLLNYVMKTQPFYEDLLSKFCALEDKPDLDLIPRNLD